MSPTPETVRTTKLHRHGTEWDEADDQELLDAFHTVAGPADPGTLAALAVQVGRTPAAVVNRLVRLGKLYQGPNGYHEPKMYAAWQDIRLADKVLNLAGVEK